MAEWSNVLGCKPSAFGLRRFESCPAHKIKISNRASIDWVFVADRAAFEGCRGIEHMSLSGRTLRRMRDVPDPERDNEVTA